MWMPFFVGEFVCASYAVIYLAFKPSSSSTEADIALKCPAYDNRKGSPFISSGIIMIVSIWLLFLRDFG